MTKRGRKGTGNEAAWQLAAIVESAEDAIISKSLDGVIKTWNPSAERMFGYTSAEAVGRSIAILVPRDRRGEEQTILRRIRAGEHIKHFETVRVRKDGSPIDISLTVAPIRNDSGSIVGASKIARDIGEQKRALETITHREEELRIITDALPALIGYVDRDLRYRFNNLAYETWLGVPRESLVGQTISSVFGPAVFHQIRPYVERALGGETARFEMWLDYPQVGYRYIDASFIPRRDGEGHVVGFFVLVSDITERARSEEVLRQKEEALERAQQVANVGSYDYDLTTGHVEWSPLLYQMFGMAPGSGGMSIEAVLSCVHPGDRARVRAALRRTIDEGEPFDLELRLLCNGRERTLLSQGEVVARDSAGKATRFIGTAMDITERKRMELEAARAQKLESIGLLAGGIAHDFNNLLTAIFGNIELARIRAGDRRDIVELLEQADKAFRRARGLTHQLLTFARGGAPVRKPTLIGPLLIDSVSFGLHGSNIRVQFDITPDLQPASVDIEQIGQVINNLVINAREAMPTGGRLRVSAKNIDLDEGNTLGLGAGRYLEITFEDSGRGIPESNLNLIFDPYFTTKEHGTGLGLPTAYSIVKRHGGHISVHSKPGLGARFCIYLPAVSNHVTATPEPAHTERRGQGRVLLMDDELLLRQVGRVLLEKLGYEVTLAANGEEAVRLFEDARREGKDFSAVILDLTVPGGMGGRECLRRTKEIDPQVRAIVSSGYSTDPVVAQYQEHGFVAVVPKPYRLHELGDAVMSAIDGRQN